MDESGARSLPPEEKRSAIKFVCNIYNPEAFLPPDLTLVSEFLGRAMSKKSGLPAVFLDEITAVTVSERMVRVTAIAGKHTLHCMLRPRDAAAVYRMLGAVLGAPSGKAA